MRPRGVCTCLAGSAWLEGITKQIRCFFPPTRSCTREFGATPYDGQAMLPRPVAFPDVDLIVVTSNSGKLVPIQMVAAACKSFSVRRRRAEIPELVVVYVWTLFFSGAIEYTA